MDAHLGRRHERLGGALRPGRAAEARRRQPDEAARADEHDLDHERGPGQPDHATVDGAGERPPPRVAGVRLDVLLDGGSDASHEGGAFLLFRAVNL
ncbi:hypothetical protein Cus16_0283 [Curtobacterium sp. ER1/6]|nr:hypothetical protein Cus16_0283 [Curtobacterium sp. ER1/6]